LSAGFTFSGRARRDGAHQVVGRFTIPPKEHYPVDDTEQLNSPFLNEELFELELSHEWEPLAEALLSESPFRSALEQPWTSADPREEAHHESLDDPVFHPRVAS
jgi:hypothetical protein